MDVIIETQSGSTFSMKLGYWYTVLEIKQTIEKSHRIPVSKQTLFFKGKVLQDHLDLEECVILHNSRIQLVISPDDNPNPSNVQVTPQTQTTEESSQPSNSIGDVIAGEDWYLTDEEFRNMEQSLHLPVTTEEPINVQDSPVMVGSNNQFLQNEQYPPLNSAGQFINVQDLPAMVGSYRNNQVFQSPVQSNSFYGQDWSLTTDENQQYWPLTANEITPAMVGSNRNDQVVQTEESLRSNSTGDIIYGQDWPFTPEETTPVMVGSNQVVQTEQSPLLHSSQQFIDVQDSPVTTWSNKKNNHMLQTEQSPLLSSPQQFTDVQDSPVTTWSIKKNDHMFQNEQSPPSNSTGNIIYCQDWSFTPEETMHKHSQQYWPVTTADTTPVMVGSNQVLQTEQSPPFNSPQQFIDVQGIPMTTWINQKNNHMLQTEQSPPLNSPQQFTDVQGFPVTTWSNKKNSHMLQTEQSLLLNSPQQFIDVEGIPVTVGTNEKDQVLQTEQSQPSNSVTEVINIPDSPVKRSNKRPPRRLRVMVMPFRETRKIPVEVNAGDHVEELRKELVKIQEKFQLNLPQDGYFFIHKQSVMDEDRSFWWNGVDPGDTIEIFPGTVTRGSTERGAY